MSDVVVLVEPVEVADDVVAELLRCRTDARSRVLRAPAHLLGSGLVLDPEGPAWWEAERIAGDAVVTCSYSSDVVGQLGPDLVATWVVWCESEAQLADCEGRGQVGVLVDTAVELVAEMLMHVLEARGGFEGGPARAEWGPFARRGPAPSAPQVAERSEPAGQHGEDADRGPGPGATPGNAGAPVPSPPAGAPPVPVMHWPELSSNPAPPPLWAAPPVPRPAHVEAGVAGPPAPLAALSVEREAAPGVQGWTSPARTSPSRAAPPRAGRALTWARAALGRDGGLGERLGALGTRLEARHSLTLGMATSKGGVLKTTHTAGEGLVGDMALSPRGASVAVVEANPDNADLGVDFAVPAEAATVRELVVALEAGRDAPRAHAVAGTRLEVWPEARQSAGHSHAQVALLHRYLASRYTLVIADFNNCLPDRTGGAAPELLDAWAPWVDVWVVPMDCSQKAVMAAAESIDALTATVRAAAGGRTPGFVVPLLVNDRGARRDAKHRALLGEFRTRGIAVVEVPHVPRVGRAALNRWRLTDVHRGLTAAWVRVLEEAVAAADEVIV